MNVHAKDWLGVHVCLCVLVRVYVIAKSSLSEREKKESERRDAPCALIVHPDHEGPTSFAGNLDAPSNPEDINNSSGGNFDLISYSYVVEKQ